MNLLCLCPTYGRPKLVANALACFLAQDYPVEKRMLLILDDAGQIGPPLDGSCIVISTKERFKSLPAKYNQLLRAAKLLWSGWDAAVVWDDDDVYLSHTLSAHAAALESAQWSHPEQVWSDYTRQLRLEPAAGRFHGSIAVRRELLEHVGGWIDTPRADFDQQMIGRLHEAGGPPGRPQPADNPGYVFRWGTTSAGHCQSLMKTPGDETWYARVPIYDSTKIDKLIPAFDDVTKQYFKYFGYDPKELLEEATHA